jgi:XTP/dITP diphosphohydrolase
MNNIILASSNQGKLREIQHALSSLSLNLILQDEINIAGAQETGSTFIENAIIKARHASQMADLPAIADDSGLVVASLDGQPGIYSARFAGVDATDQENIDKLLYLMRDVPEGQRQAHFYSVMVLLRYSNDPEPIIATGIWHGTILFAPQGKKGFGYDPIFYVPTHQCSAAELDLEEKNKISHRGSVLNQLKEMIEFIK